jgi:pyochelin biosynthesis protein PchC
VDFVMFPGAGGTALMLAPWTAHDLIDGASISAMHPPGHGGDQRNPIRRMSELVDLYVKSLVPAERPLILVGYSLGGLVAYAVAHALERRGTPPRALVISHTLPPPTWREMMFSRGKRFEQVFEQLYEAWGVDAQSRASFLDSARADFELAESFEPPSTKLSALTLVISGSADEFAPAPKLAGWEALCTRPFHFSGVGGHWDFLEHPSNREMLRAIYARACQPEVPRFLREPERSEPTVSGLSGLALAPAATSLGGSGPISGAGAAGGIAAIGGVVGIGRGRAAGPA